MASIKKIGKKACVIGGGCFMGSLLIKQLLEKGYDVNTTVRNPDNPKKISHLVALQSLGELNIFGADLTVQEDFDAPIAACELVFQFATPVNFASEDTENGMIKPGIKGVLNVLKACARAKEVKRVILTSSTAAVTINQLSGTGLVMDESNRSDVEYLRTVNPHSWIRLLPFQSKVNHLF